MIPLIRLALFGGGEGGSEGFISGVRVSRRSC